MALSKKILKKIAEESLEEIKKEIRRSSWKTEPTDLLNSFEVEVTEDEIRITSDHPAAKHLNDGVRPHRMDYLKDKVVPIPQEDGSVEFRKATPRSLADGSWHHPGIRGKHFMEKGREKAEARIKEEVAKQLQEDLAKMMKGGKL